MKKIVAAAAVSLVAFAVPANASTSKQIGMCVSAMKEAGIAPSGEFKTKFVKSRGASTKTLILDLIPASGSKVTNSCKVARGKVKSVGRA
ncbi:MAG: hypothetical protein AAF668_00365 [Pseudomonadota bacterium]